MKKDAELYVRISQEMLNALSHEADQIDETLAHVVRTILRKELTSRGHFETPADSHQEIRHRVRERAAQRRKA